MLSVFYSNECIEIGSFIKQIKIMKKSFFVEMLILFLSLFSFSGCDNMKLSDSNEVNYENLAGDYIAKLENAYGLEDFDTALCWSEQTISTEYSISDRINKSIEVEIATSGIIIMHEQAYSDTQLISEDNSYFFTINEKSPNNMIIEGWTLPWHIEILTNTIVLYQPFENSDGSYSLDIWHLKKRD